MLRSDEGNEVSKVGVIRSCAWLEGGMFLNEQ